MQPSTRFLCLAAILLAGAARAAPADCVCGSAIGQEDGWCETHEVGHLAGVEIVSKRLYETLDAHGHRVNLDSFDCAVCKQAIAADGFCEEHRVGFADGLAYFSRLTHVLAKGTPVVASDLTCPVCVEHLSHPGWCDHCKVGILGSVAIEDRGEFEDAVAALHVLHEANRAAGRCERCAVAIVTDTMCPVCRIRYKDGKQVPAEAP